MIRRPPRSTLSPSTPLFRSTRTGAGGDARSSSPPLLQASRAEYFQRELGGPDVRGLRRAPRARQVRAGGRRSEEHTSELQSQSNLVCRLLLEKKKHAH